MRFLLLFFCRVIDEGSDLECRSLSPTADVEIGTENPDLENKTPSLEI
jgi:hypothetical protein